MRRVFFLAIAATILVSATLNFQAQNRGQRGQQTAPASAATPAAATPAIAKVPGVTALFAASGDLGNFTGFRQGQPDYERAINIVHDATLKAGVRLCGPLSWRDRPDFTCFQTGSETAAIARGVAAELGTLTNTQAKPEAGPFAPKP